MDGTVAGRLLEMEEAGGSYQTWMQVHNNQLQRQRVIEQRLGPSWGIKYELEKSWAGKCYFMTCFYVDCFVCLRMDCCSIRGNQVQVDQSTVKHCKCVEKHDESSCR